MTAPEPVHGFDWVQAEHDSPYGIIRSAWKKEKDLFRLEITAPVNTMATVCLPYAPGTENLVFADAKSVAPLRNRLTFTLGSGLHVAEFPFKALMEH